MDPNDYYTLEEVMYLFHKSKSTIIREANAGAIPYMLEPGRKKGKQYPKKAIDVLVERQKKGQRQAPRFLFSYSTINDLWSEVEIGRVLYGDDVTVPYKTLLEWRDSNHEICMSLKDAGQVIAYSRFLPLDEGVVISLLEDKIRAEDIPLHALRPWSTPQLAVFIASVTTVPTGNKTRDIMRRCMLLRHTLQWAITVQHLYDITQWYGIGSTKEAQWLFESLGFTEILSLYDGARKGYKLHTTVTPSAGILAKMLEKAKSL